MVNTLEERTKEIPGAIADDSGMRKYLGYMKHNRYHVYVPTTIFDLKCAVIKVYEVEYPGVIFPHPETVIGQKYVPLASMPVWNHVFQCLKLSRRDEQKVIKALENLEKKLEPDKT